MYYKLNVQKLGHKKTLVFANKYINFLRIKSKYDDIENVKYYAPHFIDKIPDYFIKFL
tara:strand:+ start:30368 stop:30541 length:174 start_codon:yes stop_codon:yes gene_type:complete